MSSAIPNSEVAIGRRMNGSETLIDACSRSRSHTFKRAILGSWLRLRSAARRPAPRRGSGLTLLIAFALAALAPLAAALALSVLALSVVALRIPAAPFLARREIGRRRLLLPADNDLGAVGQVGKAGRYHAIGGRQPAGDHRIGFVLLRHHNRLRGDDVAVANDVGERPRGAALHRRGRYHNRFRERVDLEPHIAELDGPQLKNGIGKHRLELERTDGRIDLAVDARQVAAVDHCYPVIAEV